MVAAFTFGLGCGSSDSINNPDRPVTVITVLSWILDVGQRYELDGTATTEPKDRELEFIWKITEGGSDTDFDSHCDDDFDEICLSNDDDPCNGQAGVFCDSNADCGEFGQCMTNQGSSSEDCTTGECRLGEGDEGEFATFVADVAGPFRVRLLAVSSAASDADSMVLGTFPSLYLVGSLISFGGTEGALVGEVADAATFAPNATRGVSIPSTGNILLVDPQLGVVREFDLQTGEVLGTFGETDQFVEDPVALAFDAGEQLYVAEQGGEVKVFDGESGLLLSNFGNVGVGATAIGFSPASGNLLVVDGLTGSGVRAFDAAGAAQGVLGDTDTAVDEPADFDFLADGDLLVADATGDVIRCDGNGTACASFANAASMLEAGSPSAVAVNPSADDTGADVLIADPVGRRVIACDADAGTCEVFGETAAGGGGGAVQLDESQSADVFF